MYEEFNKMKEVLDKVEIISDGDYVKEDVNAMVKGYLEAGSIQAICQGIAHINPTESREAFNLLLKDLDEMELWKIHIILDRFRSSDKIEQIQRVACGLSIDIFVRALGLPCMVSRTMEDKGYIEACEEVLGFYIPQDEFDEVHNKMHEVIALIGSTEHAGGDIHRINRN